MGTAIVIGIAIFFLIGQNQRAQLLSAIGNALQGAGSVVSRQAASFGDGNESPIPGGTAGIPNSNGLNPNPGEQELQYLGTGGTAAFSYANEPWNTPDRGTIIPGVTSYTGSPGNGPGHGRGRTP